MQTVIKKYLAHLEKYPDGNEIQYRTPFEVFFNELAKTIVKNKELTIIQEPKRKNTETIGTPDFFVYENYGSPSEEFIGLIECKKPNTNLDKIKESEQIKNYTKTTDNIILTNYHRFILLRKDQKVYDVVLTRDHHSIQSFEELFRDFCQYDYPYINNKKTLVTELANQSFYYSVELRKFVKGKENEGEELYGKFNDLFERYPKSINYSYTLEDFCDIYSQSLVYGLLLARLDKDKKLDEVRLNYLEDIPSEYKLLYEFLAWAYEARELPSKLKPVLINIGKKINQINIPAIKKEFAKIEGGNEHIAIYLGTSKN
jgi:hypothetical protein